jgi:hypothetical protein
MRKRYEVDNPDFTKSPFTGMTKKHYAECAKFLLEKAFTHVKSIEDPISFRLSPVRHTPSPVPLTGDTARRNSRPLKEHSPWQDR